MGVLDTSVGQETPLVREELVYVGSKIFIIDLIFKIIENL